MRILLFTLPVSLFAFSCGKFENTREEPSQKPTLSLTTPDENSRIDDLQKRIVALENWRKDVDLALLGIVRTNEAQSETLAQISGIQNSMNLIEERIKSLELDPASAPALRESIEILQKQMAETQTRATALEGRQANLSESLSALAEWKLRTDNLLRDLNLQDNNSVLNQLKTWRIQAETSINSLQNWKAQTEIRLTAVENLSNSLNSCIAQLEPTGARPAPDSSQAQTCARVHQSLERLASLPGLTSAMQNQITTLQNRLLEISNQQGNDVGTFKKMRAMLFSAKLNSIKGTSPCKPETGLYLRLSENAVFSDQIVVPASGTATTGLLRTGQYTFILNGENQCSFSVDKFNHALTGDEREALALPVTTATISLARICWSDTNSPQKTVCETVLERTAQ